VPSDGPYGSCSPYCHRHYLEGTNGQQRLVSSDPRQKLWQHNALVDTCCDELCTPQELYSDYASALQCSQRGLEAQSDAGEIQRSGRLSCKEISGVQPLQLSTRLIVVAHCVPRVNRSSSRDRGAREAPRRPSDILNWRSVPTHLTSRSFDASLPYPSQR
jgi:hypothetical protein